MKYPRIRKQESNNDFWFYLIFDTVIGIIVITFFMFLIWIAIGIVNNYNKALNNCLDKGYSKEYCEYMLN